MERLPINLFTQEFYKPPSAFTNQSLGDQPSRSLSLKYNSEKHGHLFESFKSHRDFPKMHREYKVLIEELKQFCAQNQFTNKEKETINKNLDTFTSSRLDRSYSDETLALIWNTSSELLASLIPLINNTKIPLHHRKQNVLALTPGLTVCPPGIVTNLQNSFKALQLFLINDIKFIIEKKIILVEQFTMQHVRRLNSSFVILETHQVSRLMNGMATALGLEKRTHERDDDFRTQECLNYIKNELTPCYLVNQLTDDIFEEVSLILLQHHLTTAIEQTLLPVNTTCLNEITTYTENLQKRYPNENQQFIIDCHTFLSLNDEGTHYSFNKSTSLLPVYIAQGLMQHGLLKKQDAKCCLDINGQQTSLSSLLDHWFWITDRNNESTLISDTYFKQQPYLLFKVLSQVDIDSLNRLLQRYSEAIPINSVDDDGRTFFMLAALYGHYEIAKRLLENQQQRSAINKSDSNGRTALMLAAANGHAQLVTLILQQRSELFDIAINHQDNKQYTALMLAAKGGFYACVSALLGDYLIDPNLENNKGYSALMLAIRSKHKRANCLKNLKILLQHGAKVNIQEPSKGDTPLILAIKKKRLDVMEQLLDRDDLNINLRENEGHSVLAIASIIGYTEGVAKLLQHNKIDPNLSNRSGRTALSFAARYGKEEIVKLLLAHPAIGCQIRDEDGKTASDYAMRHGYTAIASQIEAILPKRAARLNHVDNALVAITQSLASSNRDRAAPLTSTPDPLPLSPITVLSSFQRQQGSFGTKLIY